jgi:RNA recognition motif-containing protein
MAMSPVERTESKKLPAETIAAEAKAERADDSRRIFIGNLNYQTKESELKAFVAKKVGNW